MPCYLASQRPIIKYQKANNSTAPAATPPRTPSTIRRPLDFRTPRYPDPVIGIRLPEYKTTIKREYVMWALVLATHHMYSTLRPPGISYWSHFTLLFNGREIGGLSFGMTVPIIENAKNITSLKNTPEKITPRADPSSETSLTSQQVNQTANLTTDLTDPAYR